MHNAPPPNTKPPGLWRARLLASNPLVLTVADWHLVLPEMPLSKILGTHKWHQWHPVWLLIQPSWTLELDHRIQECREMQQRHIRRFPNHRLIFLACTEKERRNLADAGLLAILFNHNANADETVFKPLPDVPKTYDAVYDARISKFKRHTLAAEVESLALITAFHNRDYDKDYTGQVRELLSHAHWFNDAFSPDYRRLSPKEVNESINQCRVGLCLSREEGAMYASIQYLLAGLCVVSTPSKGGRDLFFDPEYAVIVDDNPATIAKAVKDMAAKNIPPGHIRARTLEKMTAHRRRLFELMGKIAPDSDWDPGKGRWREHNTSLEQEEILTALNQAPARMDLLHTLKQRIVGRAVAPLFWKELADIKS